MRPCELASGTMEEYSLLPQGRLFINSGESIDARSPPKRTHLSTRNAEYRPLPQKSNVFPHMSNIFCFITQKTSIISVLRFDAALAIPIVSTMAVHANAFSIKEIKIKKIIKLLLASIVATTLLSACAIHYNSPRHSRPFTAVNCAAIPDALFENELFGHKVRAYNGAVGRRQGLFEIGDLPMAMQSKLQHAQNSRP